MRRPVCLAGLCLLLVVSAGPAARAQPAPVAPTAPTPGALYRDGQTGRYLLGGSWLYRADPSDVGETDGWWHGADATGWSLSSVPNSFNAGDFSQASMHGSVGWYRRDFIVPASGFAPYVASADRHWIVRFESANYRATVWLNGRRLGGHTGAYLPFEFDLGRLGSGVNRLVVRVDDRRSPADLPPGPGGGWWNFGGLQREVYLRAVQRADISNVAIVPQLTCPHCAATIQERATIHNLSNHAQLLTLRGRYGPVALDFGSARVDPGGTWQPTATALLSHPRLWSLAHPNLYRATLTLQDSKRHQLSGYVDYNGVRTIAVTPDGRLRMNGLPLNLRGVDIHEQNISTGAALSPAQLSAMMSEITKVGARVVRAHYPLNPELEEMADRDGVLLWSEVPVYQVADQYLDQSGWLAGAHRFLQQNILTNQNHPSIMLWSVGNELSTPAGRKEADYIAGAAALAHQLDPTRPVGMATSGWPGVPCQPAYAPLDVIGHNDYFGWFDAGGGSNDDRDQLGPFLDSLRTCYPHQAIMVTEFGFDGNRHGPIEERGTYEFQSNTAAYHLAAFASKTWLSGAMWWSLQDFAARPGWGGGNPRPDPPFVEKGLVDLAGNPKPVWSVVSQVFHHTRQTGSG